MFVFVCKCTSVFLAVFAFGKSGSWLVLALCSKLAF